MPIFGNNDRQIALQPFHIVSYETVDQEFNKNSWETTNLDFLESQIGDLMLDVGFDNRAAGTVQRSSSSTPAASTGPMIWVFLGVIAITAALFAASPNVPLKTRFSFIRWSPFRNQGKFGRNQRAFYSDYRCKPENVGL